MEERKRKPFEGVTNIIRFNWHFYVLAFVVAIALFMSKYFVYGNVERLVLFVLLLLLFSVVFSLGVSFYVYDCSDLYSLHWLYPLPELKKPHLVNINAGFDETSFLLKEKYPDSVITVLDFYNPDKHTELSIARARKRYAPYPNTIDISTDNVPLQQESVDCIFAILSVHEIRNRDERIAFFQQLKKVMKKEGYIVVAEHIRNVANFIAYNIGFFHFLSQKEWKQTFNAAGFTINKEALVTPFIHVYFLHRNESAT